MDQEFLDDFNDDGALDEDQPSAQESDNDSSSDSDDMEEEVNLSELISPNSNEPKKQVRHDAAFTSLLSSLTSPSPPSPPSPITDLQDKLNLCNQYLSKIASETLVWHRLASQAYSPIFPELEKLVVDPVDFSKVVLQFGESDACGDLGQILNNATVMVVKVSKSAHANSIAQMRDKGPLKLALKCCGEILQLNEWGTQLLAFCEVKLQAFAPNLYELTGGRTAALLLSLAGGLQRLSQIPSNDIQVLGKRKQGDTAAAHGENVIFLRHSGVLAQCPLVLSSPPDLRRRIVRVLAGRVALAARVDDSSSSKSSANGKLWRSEIEQKIAQWQAPNQGKVKKALPVPDMQRPKRRGGRRARKLKEKMGSTSMLKLANRDQFGDGADANVEYSVSAMGEDLGLLSKQQNGRVRQIQVKNTQRLGDRAAQQNSKRLKQINTGGSLASGFTSLAFTPVQGMELGAGQRPIAVVERQKPAVPLFQQQQPKRV
ncbi:hypothetical protein BASA81_001188 [Batrachochytrium salamandrivorans]|nr:hypothetical protein BASA81_001188 [Batrachochytrium salamandrivorans]